MPDKLTIAQRHACMAAIRGKDTKPEIIVRKYLWRHGFRYRLNHPRLPGKPDVVLRKYRTCIFVNGCFWHGHGLAPLEANSEKRIVKSGTCDVRNDVLAITGEIQDSGCCKIPKTNTDFWVKKIRRNQERDVEVQQRLAQMGWHSITVWECQLKVKERKKTLDSLAYTLNHIYLNDRKPARQGYETEEASMLMVAEEEIDTNQ